MDPRVDSVDSGDFMSKKKNERASAVNRKTQSKAAGSFGLPESKRQCTGHDSVSAVLSTKPHGKAAVGDLGAEFLSFADVTPGPHEAELLFRLIHHWEARNPRSKTLIGEEMLLIDEKGMAIQGFIPSGRVDALLPYLVSGSVYKLGNFFGSNSKTQFRVADHNVTVTFTWNSVLTLIENCPVQIPEDMFRFHTWDEFEAKCDQRGDLYDYVGHMKLVCGQPIASNPILDEVDLAEKRHVLVHVQTHDGPVMKLYLWDKAALDFCQKFKAYGGTPSVLLVTTVNPKRLGGTLALTTMSSSRVFMDTDVQPTRDYMSWFSSNLDIANKINADVVTKPEVVTISELFAYMKQESAKVAWFECRATIDDVLHGSAWYYISCGGCNTKATKGANSLVCTNKKCKKTQVTGVPQYITKISVYDKSEQAVFVVVGDAGRELTGRHASELVAKYYEDNENVGDTDFVPVPRALVDTIGKTYSFIVKISEHNLTGKSQSITVTKVLPSDPPKTSVENAASEKVGEDNNSG